MVCSVWYVCRLISTSESAAPTCDMTSMAKYVSTGSGRKNGKSCTTNERTPSARKKNSRPAPPLYSCLSDPAQYRRATADCEWLEV